MLLKIDNDGYFLEDILSDIIPYLTKIVIEVITNEDGSITEIPHEEIIMHEIYDENNQVIGSEPTLDPHYVSILCPLGFYRPKWNGYNWVEGLTQEEIDAIKNSNTYPTNEEKITKLAQDINDALLAIMILSIE
jgi:hypothetical protein